MQPSDRHDDVFGGVPQARLTPAANYVEPNEVVMLPATVAAIDTYWAADLGVPVEVLHRAGVHVVAHGAKMARYRGAYLLRHDEAVVFTVPRPWAERVRQAASDQPPDAVFTPQFLADLFGDAVDVGIGPGYQGFVDAADFRPADGRGTRPLTEQDAPALTRLRAACDETDWAHSAVSLDRHELNFGCFDGSELVSAGMLEKRGESVVFVRIISHPDHREWGYGRAVVSAMTTHALEHGLIPRYQTLFANVPSVAIARSLGYVEYGATLAVRLRRASPYE